MRNKNIFIVGLLGLVVGMSSCDDFLDELPDQRTEVTEYNANLLLVSAYPYTLPCEIYEMYSDNTDAYPDRYPAMDRLQEDLYKWADTSETGTDSPNYLWQGCYNAIASANQVLAAIEESENPESLNAEKGEALVCRAFNHFLLATTFCKAYTSTASTDMGIPYMKHAETTVSPSYERGTLEDTYKSIEKDLLEGIPLIDDTKYSVPKYHFTKNAAYAFAARFYQNYIQTDGSNNDKVIDYATRVLGADPSSKLRNWEELGGMDLDLTELPDTYVSATAPANLLLICGHSYWSYVYGKTDYGTRYAHGPEVAVETCYSDGPWGDYSAAKSAYYLKVWSNSSSLPTKVFYRKIEQYFQITDPVAQTGTGYIVNAMFTTDELLLARAEAYILKKDYASALTDLNYWLMSYTSSTAPLTEQTINDFYENQPYYTPQEPTVKKELHPDFAVEPGTQENMLHCLLHARRLTTLHEGLRWLDIKRYGIKIYRRFINDDKSVTVTDEMDADDPRRAIQIPSDVISAGLEANPR